MNIETPSTLQSLRITPILALILALTLPAAAGDYGFLGPEIYRVDPGAQRLEVADFDGDGLCDLAVINNAKATIEILYQRTAAQMAKAREEEVRDPEDTNKVGSDYRFEKGPLLTEKRIFSMAVGDFNGDGKADIAYYGDPPELIVACHGAGRSWPTRKSFPITDGSEQPYALAAGDINGDGRCDLVLLGRTDTYILLQQKDGALAQPVKLPNSFTSAVGVMIADVNNDGRNDLLYVLPSEQKSLRIRLQGPDGKLGPEIAEDIESIRSLEVGDCDGKGKKELCVVMQASGRLRILKLAEPRKSTTHKLDQIEIYPLPSGPQISDRKFAVGDVDGDGKADVVVSDPAAASLIVFHQKKAGGFADAEVYPSILDGRSLCMADFDGDGKCEIVVASPKEEVVAISRQLPNKRLSFPTPIKAPGKPLCVASGDINKDGIPDLAYVCKEGGILFLAVCAGQKGAPLAEPKRIPLKDVANDPSDAIVADVNGDGRSDVVLFIPYQVPVVLLQDEQGGFANATRKPGFREGLIGKIPASAFTMADLKGDGKMEMLFSKNNFARGLTMASDGTLTVLDQYNGRSPQSQIAGAMAIPCKDAKGPAIALVDVSAKAVSLLLPDDKGVYRVTENLETGAFDFKGICAGDFSSDGVADILIFASDRLVLLPLQAPAIELQEVASHETAIENGAYGAVAIGDVNSDKIPDIVALEVRKHHAEILSFDKTDQLKRKMTWKVFDEKSFTGRPGSGPEPREAILADATGDGRNDIILLCHDRILLYPQEPPK